jgi:hypothetical protein
MRAFIISASLVLALTQVGMAEEGNSGLVITQGCRYYLNDALPESVPESLMTGFLEGKCVGTIQGLTGMARLQKPSPFCVPDSVTNEQEVRVVVNYIDRHPEKMHLYFSYLAYDALREAWPCKP